MVAKVAVSLRPNVSPTGNWYQVEIGGRTGWANAHWLRNDCGY
ncbi:hypothetical protein ACYG9R_24425 [Mesorhizobium sp. RSR565B]|nr:hypothetical protein [Mesorhizobium sp. L103C565B0]